MALTRITRSRVYFPLTTIIGKREPLILEHARWKITRRILFNFKMANSGFALTLSGSSARPTETASGLNSFETEISRDHH